MNDDRFSEADITSILKQYDEGISVDELCRKNEISLNILYRWKANLLSNAFKYSKKKEEARIDVTCSVEKDEVCYQVSDNGAGFDMQYEQKLFGVF